MGGSGEISGQQCSVALKVDVATYPGARDGIPRLLAILDRAGVKATFYFAMGPDNSGKIIRRIFRARFLRKLFTKGAVAVPGLPSLLYGTLLPPPYIAEQAPDMLRQVESAGHDIGILCWDHLKWHDYLPWLPKQAALMELGRASAAFETVFGHRSRTTAAPGWTASVDSLEIQDAMRLAYCSDCRGSRPFYPLMDGRKFRTLQIPTTLPPLDELLGEGGITAATVNDRLLSRLLPGLNVHTIRAELEGIRYAPLFAELLDQLKARGVRFATLAEVAEEYGDDAPHCAFEMGYLPGCVMPVALQTAGEQ